MPPTFYIYPYKICTRVKIVAPIVYFMYTVVITSDFFPRIEWQQAIGMLRSRTSYMRIKMLLTEAYGTKTWDTVNTACPTQPGRIIDRNRIEKRKIFRVA